MSPATCRDVRVAVLAAWGAWAAVVARVEAAGAAAWEAMAAARVPEDQASLRYTAARAGSVQRDCQGPVVLTVAWVRQAVQVRREARAGAKPKETAREVRQAMAAQAGALNQVRPGAAAVPRVRGEKARSLPVATRVVTV